jgi:hypothetical protein
MPENPIDLETSEASITTASVTIRTLRVNSRQLTLATFRQLPCRELVDERMATLQAKVWGWVNYSPPGENPKATQFVAQFENRLYRSPIILRQLPDDWWTRHLTDLNDRYVREAWNGVRALAVNEPEGLNDRFITTYPYGYEREELCFAIKDRLPFKPLTFNGHRLDGMPGYHDFRLMETIAKPCARKEYQEIDGNEVSVEIPPEEVKARAIASLSKRLLDEEAMLYTSSEQLNARLDQMAGEAADYVNRWNTLMQELKSYEQLYIAT